MTDRREMRKIVSSTPSCFDIRKLAYLFLPVSCKKECAKLAIAITPASGEKSVGKQKNKHTKGFKLLKEKVEKLSFCCRTKFSKEDKLQMPDVMLRFLSSLEVETKRRKIVYHNAKVLVRPRCLNVKPGALNITFRRQAQAASKTELCLNPQMFI